MTYRIVPRTEIGLPAVVTTSGGRPRPPLSQEKWLTSHYTGVNTIYNGRDVPAQIRHIQRIFEDSKPFEYNYVVGQTDDDLIYEFAGKFQAAHSGGENSQAFGVLFLNGVGEALTQTQIRKYQWLRDVLIFDGSLRADVIEEPHKDMPGAATICPGFAIMRSWDQMMQPFPQPEPEPEPYTEEDMTPYITWKHADEDEVFLVGGGGVVHLDWDTWQHYKSLGVPHIESTNFDVYLSYMKVSGT